MSHATVAQGLDDANAALRRALIRNLAASWNQRATGQHLKQGSVKYSTHQLEFMMGAHAALLAQGHAGLPEMLLVCISVGRDINDFVRPLLDEVTP